MDVRLLMEWATSHETLLAAAGIAGAVIFLLTAFAVPFLVNMIPHDYFLREKRRESVKTIRGLVVFAVFMVLKNLAGTILVLAGFVLLFMPGQGILTIFIGLILLDFPGKWELQKRFVQSKKVADALNWIRRRGGRKELEIPGRG